jgi:hypothetical protein
MSNNSVYVTNMTVNQEGKFNLTHIPGYFYNVTESFWAFIFNDIYGKTFISNISGNLQNSAYMKSGVSNSLFACHFPGSANTEKNGQKTIAVAFGYSLSQGDFIKPGSYMFVLINPSSATASVSPYTLIQY